MRAPTAFLMGVVLGAAGWATAFLASGTFEPFDSATGFVVCQTVLVPMALAIGMRAGLRRALLCLSGAWIGMNVYAYVAGGDDTRVWIVLLLVSSLTLLAMPLAAAIAGGIVHAVRRRRTGIADAVGR